MSRRRRCAKANERAPALEVRSVSTSSLLPLPLRWRWAAAFLLLLGLTVAAYVPCFTGGPVWDDDAHITRSELQSVDGLKRIWTEVTATQQYYPLLHSAFWLEHRLWGDDPLGYHLVNVVLHALAAALLAALWSRLGFRGGFLAAALFAIHPVAVESVAWISEQKNTLSTVLYLSAALAFLSFHETRAARWYLFATSAFGAALLTKSVTSTLPAALLVLLWWRTGRLSWRRDVAPLVPWFVLSGAMAGVTVWVERKVVGAEGAEWELGLAERCLVAGRGAWFYLKKLIWPSDLVFIYPKWSVDPSAMWQWLFPAAAILVLGGLWWLRKRSRAPLAVALLFLGSVFPALGFFSIYPFRYSFVADHFQYLGAMYVLAGAATGAGVLAERFAIGSTARLTLASAGVLLLGVLTWRQANDYRDAETLYRSILASDRDSWFAHHNLGMLYVDRGQHALGIEHIERALRLKGDAEETHFGLAHALARSGRETEALALYERALGSNSSNADAENNFGNLLRRLGRVDEAVTHLERAIELDPRHAEAHHNLGLTLAQAGRWTEAEAQYEAALEARPELVDAWLHRGIAMTSLGRIEEAIEHFRQALRLNPNSSEAERRLGIALAMTSRLEDARLHLEAAVRLRPEDASAHISLANALIDSGRIDESIGHYEEALRLDPTSATAHDRLGVALSRGARASEAESHFETAVKLAPDDSDFRYDLAVAQSRAGRRDEALMQLRRALELEPGHARARALLHALQSR